jgi:hypothetical protein
MPGSHCPASLHGVVLNWVKGQLYLSFSYHSLPWETLLIQFRLFIILIDLRLWYLWFIVILLSHEVILLGLSVGLFSWDFPNKMFYASLISSIPGMSPSLVSRLSSVTWTNVARSVICNSLIALLTVAMEEGSSWWNREYKEVRKLLHQHLIFDWLAELRSQISTLCEIRDHETGLTSLPPS